MKLKNLVLLLASAGFALAQGVPVNVQKTPGTNAITGSLVIGAGKTLTASGGGTITASGVSAAGISGVIPIANLATGTPDGTKFVADDGTLKSVPGGGDALTANPLNQFAATTSAQLAGVLTNETGTTFAVFSDSPVFTTQITTPKIVYATSVIEMSGTGTPEGAVTANIGSVFHRTNGSTATTLYVKESGTGNTGWAAIGGGGGGGSPGGSNTQLQYNNSSAFGGIANATSDGTTLTLTSPKLITALNDTNGNEILKVTATGSAVNEFTIANSITGNGPTLSATGGDTDIDIAIAPKGTGKILVAAPISIGIPTATPVTGQLKIYGTTIATSSIGLRSSNNTGDQTSFYASYGRGTAGTPAAINSGDVIFNFAAGGFDGSNWIENQASFFAITTENWSTGARGLEWWFGATINGSTSQSVPLKISGDHITIPVSTASTSTTSGALVVTGGVGVGGALTVAGNSSAPSVRFGVMEIQSFATNNTAFADNVYYDGSNNKYRTTGFGSYIQFNDGEIWFRTAPSGTGGTNATVTTYLTIGNTGTVKMATAAPLAIASGTNQRAGNATLVGGTVTVSNTTVTANTIVMLTRKSTGGTIGFAVTYTVSAATSFTITSDNVLDTSTYSYLLIEVP